MITRGQAEKYIKKTLKAQGHNVDSFDKKELENLINEVQKNMDLILPSKAINVELVGVGWVEFDYPTENHTRRFLAYVAEGTKIAIMNEI